MAYLPLANIMHYKLRSVLSAVGIGVGICMLITVSGLTRGSLFEVSDRWEAIDADLIVYPSKQDVTIISGGLLSDHQVRKVADDNPELVGKVVPVYFMRMRLANQDQMVAGVDRADFPTLARGGKLLEGHGFTRAGDESEWDDFEKDLAARHTAGMTDEQKARYALDISKDELAAGNWLEIIIDHRLARAGKYKVGDIVQAADCNWRIVGIAPAGVSSRVFMPRRTAQQVFGGGDMRRSTMAMVKLQKGADDQKAIAMFRDAKMDAMPVTYYKDMLQHTFGVMFTYVDVVNAIVLLIAFLFVMVTLYMMVLQRTREIAILKSAGASGWFILRQVMGESAILTASGTALGVALSFLAATLIEKLRPLLTVDITLKWIVVAAGAALAGAIAAAIYPAWRATRVDMIEALSLE
jgi:ABC-type lipoprotein release transport system permease subunit